MKKLFTLVSFCAAIISKSQCSYTLSTSSTNGYTITCANPTLHLLASTNSTNGAQFTWAGPSFTANTSTVNITQPGNYTITSLEFVTTCTLTQTISISINTTAVSSSVTPNSLTVTCNNPATFTTTALSPTANIQHSWIVPVPGAIPSNMSSNVTAITDLYAGTGTYTYILTDLSNGCKTTQTVSVFSPQAYPTFSLYSQTNFTLGCSPLDQTTINIINPVSTQTPPAT